MRIFRDRAEAGRLLGAELASRGVGTPDAPPIVLAIPRGAVVIGAEVARALDAPMDVIVVRKVGAPGNPEFAIAAVDADGVTVGDPGRWATQEYAQAEAARQRDEITRREAAYRAGRPALDPRGATAVVVDDGVATGLTALAAIGWLRRHDAARVVFAAPVGAPDAISTLRGVADDVVVLEAPWGLGAVGAAYEDFRQVEDAEVVELLAQFAHDRPPAR